MDCRLIVDSPRPGAWNMAVDEVLLDAAAYGGLATLRLYAWSEPTLSLGYFQAYDDRHRHPASRECPVVRRHSGGGAIMHHRELTYSLALPAPCIPPGGPLTLYNLTHRILVRVLGDLLPAANGRLALCGVGRDLPTSEEPFLCFARRSEGDVLVRSPKNDVSENRDHKIIGSAQRKRRGAVVQHGSVLLAQSESAPELPGIAEELSVAPDPEELGRRFSQELADSLGFSLQLGGLEASELQSVERIAAGRFESEAWTRRR